MTYLYLCLSCGFWYASNGFAETFGTLKGLPGIGHVCPTCQTAMYHVQPDDKLIKVDSIIEARTDELPVYRESEQVL